MWLRVSRSDGKKLTRGAANSSAVSASQALSSRWLDQALFWAMATKWPTNPVAMVSSLCRVREVAQDVVQDAAVLEVLDLLGGIDAAGQGDLLAGAVAAMDGHRDVHAGLEAALDAAHVEALVAGEVQRLAGHAVLELQRQHAHADQVRAMDALEGLAYHRLHAEQVDALGRPVARRTGAVLLAGDQDLRRVFLLVAHRHIVDRLGLVGLVVMGEAALDARH